MKGVPCTLEQTRLVGFETRSDMVGFRDLFLLGAKSDMSIKQGARRVLSYLCHYQGLALLLPVAENLSEMNKL